MPVDADALASTSNVNMNLPINIPFSTKFGAAKQNDNWKIHVNIRG
jgi:hypothetical protein